MASRSGPTTSTAPTKTNGPVLLIAKARDAQPKLLRSVDLPLDRIEPNPLNPRPDYHFEPDDPTLARISDSMLFTGQQNPAKVYEIDGRPGYYRLIQGHRRYSAARTVGKPTLSCVVVAAPTSLAEELDDLGSDDAFKEEWGTFSKMDYARQVVVAHGFGRLNCAEVVSRTGLTPSQLITAEKMFKLDPTIYAHVRAWEEHTYHTRTSEDSPAIASELSGSKIHIPGFSPDKAAICWDLFQTLRENAGTPLAEWTDEALQLRLAQLCSRAKKPDLESWKMGIRTISQNPGALSQIMDVLENNYANQTRSVAALVHSTRNAQAARLTKLARTLDRQQVVMNNLIAHPDQYGADTALLEDVLRSLLMALTSLERLTDRVKRQITATKRRQEF